MARSSFHLKKLCTPSLLYFIVSFLALFFIGIQNSKNVEILCLGKFECYVGNNMMIFLLNAIYILFWTFILDLLCKNGWTDLSWFIFLLPFILSFLFYGLILFKFS
jgi:hypothetical protein